MNNEMAYLLGMITGNGEIQRGSTTTTISIDVPHKKLETEFQKNVGIYVKASITDIRQILEPLLGTALKFIQNPNISILSFTKPNEDYLIPYKLIDEDKGLKIVKVNGKLHILYLYGKGNKFLMERDFFDYLDGNAIPY